VNKKRWGGVYFRVFFCFFGGGGFLSIQSHQCSIPVFLNRRAVARYRALVSIVPGHERFSWNLLIYFSKQFSLLNVLYWKYSEEENVRECVEKLRPRCWPEETTICYKISLVQSLINNLSVILCLSTCHTVYISALILFMIVP